MGRVFWSSQETSGLFFLLCSLIFLCLSSSPCCPPWDSADWLLQSSEGSSIEVLPETVLVWCPQGLLTSLYLLQSSLRKLLLQPEGTDREAVEKLSLVGSQNIEEHCTINLLYSYYTLPLLLFVLIYVYSCVQGVWTQELRLNKLDSLQHVWF